MRYLLFIAAFLLAVPGRAQVPGTCEPGRAQAVLYVNDVRATVFTTGRLFYGNEVDNGSGYVIPHAEATSAIFLSRLWVGGKVDGEVRTAGGIFQGVEFWPGPLQDGAVLPNPADCSAYDRIFVVSRQDVARYLQTGEATDDLRDWPVDWGAPVLDGDGIDGNYDLEAGDQPAIYGAQTAWWVMNDVGNEHTETESDPLGIEVQVTAFASPDGARAIQQATFYRYRIINRNTRPLEDAYASFFADPDLGDAADDHVATDTTYSMGIVYNGDSDDGVYEVPPALGFQVVQGPVGLPNGRDDDGDGAVDEAEERVAMTRLSNMVNAGGRSITYPGEVSEYYHRMQGRWNDGTPVTEGGGGYQTEGPVTVFAYPGDPVTGAFWSEISEGNAPGNRVLAVHTGPFRLDSGQSAEVVIALPFAQGTDHLDSITQLRLAAQVTQNAWDTGFLAPSRVEAAAPPDVPGAVALTAPMPNPFRDRLTLRYTLPDAMPARVTVLDVLGREVAVLAQGEQAAGPRTVEVDTERWPSGVYLVRVEVDTESRTFSMVKAQ